MPDWKAMLAAVQEECLTAIWSRGVALARSEAVVGDDHDEREWNFRVRVEGDVLSPTVRLYPGDHEWDCDCEGPTEPCEHVAACAIAAARIGGDLDELYSGEGSASWIRYEFRRTRGALVLDRFLCRDDEVISAIEGPLEDFCAGEVALGYDLLGEDLDVDPFAVRGGPFSADRARRLLGLLGRVRDLRLEGRPLRASSEGRAPRAILSDGRSGAIDLAIEVDPVVDEIVGPGIVRCGETLHPMMGDVSAFGVAWEKLPLRRTYARPEFADLASRVVPRLEKQMEVEVRTRRLPGRTTVHRPWMSFEIESSPEGLDVLPQIVYGDPPVARLDGDRLLTLAGEAPQRDAAAEKELLLRLRDRLHLVPGRRVRLEAQDAARFLSGVRSFDDGRPDARSPGSVAEVELAARITGEGEKVGVAFAPVGEDTGPVPAEAVLSAWQQGLDVVPLSGGNFARIPEGWLEKHGTLLSDFLQACREAGGGTPPAALPMLGELCEGSGLGVPPAVERLRALLEQSPTDVRTIPGDEVLRGYQRDGVQWLRRHRAASLGAVLADDMGLGKTVQTLFALEGRTLVVCPRSVIHNWTREAERFRPDLSVALFHGPGRELTDADLTLTTYATLRADLEVLSAVSWDAVVLDEAQAIKNPDSQAARAAFSLQAGFRLSLSGTPVENRLDELWSQMHFTNPGLLGGRRAFVERYERGLLAGDSTTSDHLRRRLRPFLLRRTKSEVVPELPPRTETTLFCELDPRERDVYEAVRLATREDVVRQLGEGTRALAVLEALLRLRQAACHTGLLPGQEAQGSSKVEAVADALGDAVAGGHKALVFSQWTGLLDRVEPHLQARGVDFTRLDGSTRDRAAVVDDFQDPSGPPVLLASLMAGGTGLNLTAADHVFLLDPWWNPAVEDQAADRAHRIGQDKPVMIYRVVAKDTVEERVLALQMRKRQIAGAALEGASIDGLVTREDLLALLDD
jgi:superfamily II DNA or RNA helicase